MSGILSAICTNYAIASPVTYATWNPADKNANITLSNGNLTATGPGSLWFSARANIGKSSGKWYWELKPSSTTQFLFGVGKSTASIADSFYCGLDANGWGFYFGTGTAKYNNGISAAYGDNTNYGPSDTIGIALDMDAGTITIYANNISQGTMFSGLSGTIYPMMSAGNGVTANFGATALAYTPPVGFNAGLYE